MPDKPLVRIRPLGDYPQAELSSSPSATAEDSQPQLGAALPNSLLQPLSVERIERLLSAMGVRYRRQSEQAIFTVSSSDASDLSVLLFVDGDERNILRVTCTDKRKIMQPQWSSALLICNQYHATFRYGRVYLDIQEGRSEGIFLFDAQLLLEVGVSEDLLKSFIVVNITCAHDFFDNAKRAKGLYRNGKRRVNGKRMQAKGVEA
jgi:hypothetical protein